jgi:hypothetical protein
MPPMTTGMLVLEASHTFKIKTQCGFRVDQITINLTRFTHSWPA